MAEVSFERLYALALNALFRSAACPPGAEKRTCRVICHKCWDAHLREKAEAEYGISPVRLAAPVVVASLREEGEHGITDSAGQGASAKG
jgi:hypothetical protein